MHNKCGVLTWELQSEIQMKKSVKNILQHLSSNFRPSYSKAVQAAVEAFGVA